jgi:hypothetical protein
MGSVNRKKRSAARTGFAADRFGSVSVSYEFHSKPLLPRARKAEGEGEHDVRARRSDHSRQVQSRGGLTFCAQKTEKQRMKYDF